MSLSFGEILHQLIGDKHSIFLMGLNNPFGDAGFRNRPHYLSLSGDAIDRKILEQRHRESNQHCRFGFFFSFFKLYTIKFVWAKYKIYILIQFNIYI